MKKVCSALLCVLLVFSLVIPAFAADGEEEGEILRAGDYGYYEKDGGAVLAAYYGTGGALELPSSLGGLPVTEIGREAFEDCAALTSVTIPETVTSIGVSAFSKTGLTEVTVPGNVKVLDAYAFYKCTALTEVTLQNGVESVLDFAFTGCTILSSFTVADSVTHLGYDALERTAWLAAQPDGIVFFGKAAYTWKGEMPSGTALDFAPDTVGIADWGFFRYPGIASVSFPETLRYIGEYAFSECGGLTSLSIPDSVEIIGMHAFDTCRNLANVTFGEGVKRINCMAFNHTALTTVTLPDSVETLEASVFDDCAALISVTFGAGLTEIVGLPVFSATPNLSSITVVPQNRAFSSEDGVLFDKDRTTLYQYPTAKAGDYVIPEGVQRISEEAFYRAKSVGKVTCPGSVRVLEFGAFYYSSVTGVVLPAAEEIGDYAFYACQNLKDAQICGSPVFGEAVFSENASVALSGYPGSSVEAYAEENGFSYTVVYPYTVSVSVEGAGSVTVRRNGEAPVSAAAIGLCDGDTATLTAQGKRFLFWKNAKNGVIVSTDPSLTVPSGRSMAFVACFEPAPQEECCTVYFRDSMTGRIFSVAEVAPGTVLGEDDFPAVSFFGYELVGWRISGADALGKRVNTSCVAYSVYRRDDTQRFSVTVVENGKTVTVSRAFAQTLALYTGAEDFSYWAEDGRIISLDRALRFSAPSRDCTLTAVCGAQNVPAAVVAPVDFTLQDGTLYYLLSRSIPAGAEHVETGVLMTRQAQASDLTLDTALNTVTRGVSTAPSNHSVVGFVKDVREKPGAWLVRGYLIYTLAGRTYTVYSDAALCFVD